MKQVTKVLFNYAIIIFLFISNTTSAQMFWNQAASFAGNNTSYISIPNSASVNITGGFTVEAWINPSSLSGISKGIMAKGLTLGTAVDFGVRLSVTGRILIMTNGAQRLISRSSTALKINTWTHIAAVYSSGSSVYKIFINGVLDTTSTVAASSPAANTDSLFVGISGSTTPFNGKMDEVRLWNRGLPDSEVGRYFRSSLGATTGIYSGLILSMTFQERNSLGSDFSVEDISDNGNNGHSRNITPVDQGNNPYSTIVFNESIQLNGNNDYLVCKDTTTLDLSSGVTLECWVYPLSLSFASRFISKGISPAVYALGYNSSVFAIINGTTISTTLQIPLGQWTHVSFKYSSSGFFIFFINGVSVAGGINTLGAINNSPDSLYIGGSSSITDFTGFIDEVRIFDFPAVNDTIASYAYKSIDRGNNPPSSVRKMSYNLDGTLTDNADNGGPKLIMRGRAKFSHPGILSQPVSPVNRDDEGSFYNGYYLKTSSKAIPESGSSGIIYDSLRINNDLAITDVNLFVALNHGRSEDLQITLTGPSGDSIVIFNNTSTNSLENNIITIFDDQADSSLVNGRLSSFSPKIKPANSLISKFLTKRSKGLWKIKINDMTVGNIGFFYNWGIQINNQSARQRNLEIIAMMQGFYNPSTNLMIPDTMRVIQRNVFSPYAIQNTIITVMDGNGKGYFSYNFTTSFYTVLKHRNSIETWNVVGNSGDRVIDFLSSPGTAFGNNEIQIDNSPTIRYGIYSGDVNQDGTIDGTDTQLIDNDASSFLSGYLATDINGDGFIDGSDALITFNNAANFVSAITP